LNGTPPTWFGVPPEMFWAVPVLLTEAVLPPGVVP